MPNYEIKEPWPTRLREAAAFVLICSWKGHKRPQKMYSLGACERCGR